MSVHGRQGEVARLVLACREAVAGNGHLVLISGEAGIGKSRLAQAAAEEAAALGMAGARGWCMDDPAAPPLWPWRRVARDVEGLGDALNTVQGVDADDGAQVEPAPTLRLTGPVVTRIPRGEGGFLASLMMGVVAVVVG